MSLSSRRSGSRRQFSKNARRETLTMTEFIDDDRLYLDDLHIGQRFTSGTHVVDEEQIKAFARQFDPQPFHLDTRQPRTPCSRAWWQADGTLLRSPCTF